MKKGLFILFIVLCAGITAFAIESSKPETHNASWEVLHGKQVRVSDRECLVCHTDRIECIMCHEDTKPRSHTATWTTKTHGMEGRWNRNTCKTCHMEDFCVECHETQWPTSHKRSSFRNGVNSHCQTSCQLPRGRWTNTPAKDCLVCHRERPVLPSGALHQMN